MNDSATSLDRLHDIVTPAPVPWWPPAAGWYVVLTLVVCGLLLFGYRSLRRWRANAYRREALRELAAAGGVAEVAALLRRTALAIAPRSVVAAQTGARWPEWLAAHCSEPMPPLVRDQLAIGVYRDSPSKPDLSALKTYAESWILRHQTETTSASQTEVPPQLIG